MSVHPYDEMTANDGGIRPHYRAFADWLERTDASRIAQKREEAERAFHRVGITFAVYGEDAGTERLIPFDIVPRIIPAEEWADARSRVQATRARAEPVPGRRLSRAEDPASRRAIPSERVLGNTQYRREMAGMDVPGGMDAHIAGVDIVRAGAGEYYVLEENLRVPSGAPTCSRTAR